MKFPPRLCFAVGGNRYTGRASFVRCYTSDGNKDVPIPPDGPIKLALATICELRPSKVECYAKDGKLLRALDMTTEDGEPDLPGAEPWESTHVTGQERLLSHFAKLLAEGRKNSDDMMRGAFKSLASIAEHHANRASGLETRNAQLQNALVKQTGQLMNAQLAAAQAAAEGSGEAVEGLAELMAAIREGKGMANGGTQ